MAPRHAIGWTHAAAHPDRETLVLPRTRHDPRAPLWVHTYRALLFDHAKHAWCADPSRLSAPARACFEPLWQDLAARELASMGPPSLSSVAGVVDPAVDGPDLFGHTRDTAETGLRVTEAQFRTEEHDGGKKG